MTSEVREPYIMTLTEWIDLIAWARDLARDSAREGNPDPYMLERWLELERQWALWLESGGV